MKGGDREKTEKAGKSSHVCIHMCMAIRNNMYRGSWRRPRLGGGGGGQVKAAVGKERWDGRHKVERELLPWKQYHL
jgi:hypothetical protein